MFSIHHLAAGLTLILLLRMSVAGALANAFAHPIRTIAGVPNANIIQYDAQVAPDGKLLKKEPVVGYWIRLAEQGQVQASNQAAYDEQRRPDREDPVLGAIGRVFVGSDQGRAVVRQRE